MIAITIAIGTKSTEEAGRLKAKLPSLILVTRDNLVESHVHENDHLCSRLAKTGFAEYIPEGAEGQVVLLDADLYPAVEDALAQIPPVNQIGGVVWKNTRAFYPPPFAEIPPDINRITSGMLVFENRSIATTISERWHQNFKDNQPFEYDELNLTLALTQLSIAPTVLEEKFNSRSVEGGVFLHTHYVEEKELDEFLNGKHPPEPPPLITAEQWIESQGYPAMRLVSLMDIEGKLSQSGRTSAKLVAVRAWLDGVMVQFAASPEPRNNWSTVPFSFEETMQDAMVVLTAPPL